MRAVVFDGPGAVKVADVATPRIVDPGDAVVRVSLTAICGSDLHLLDGKTPGMRVGSVIGHEFVGIVEQAGPEAVGVAEGDRVVGCFLIACGRCANCSGRRYNHCSHRRALGLGTLTGDLDGAQAEMVRVPNAALNLKPLTDRLASVDDENALLCGDVLATGFYAASLGDSRPGDSVVVVGAGPVGLLCAAAARRASPGNLLLLDSDPERVRFAESCGFDAALTPPDDPASPVAAATSGQMADVTFEAVGAIPALKTALRCARPGGRIVVVGVYGAERYELPLGATWVRSLDLRFAGMANVQAHWGDALEAVARGEIDPSIIITHRLGLESAPEGYELFRERRAVKVTLMP